MTLVSHVPQIELQSTLLATNKILEKARAWFCGILEREGLA